MNQFNKTYCSREILRPFIQIAYGGPKPTLQNEPFLFLKAGGQPWLQYNPMPREIIEVRLLKGL